MTMAFSTQCRVITPGSEMSLQTPLFQSSMEPDYRKHLVLRANRAPKQCNLAMFVVFSQCHTDITHHFLPKGAEGEGYLPLQVLALKPIAKRESIWR